MKKKDKTRGRKPTAEDQIFQDQAPLTKFVWVCVLVCRRRNIREQDPVDQ